MAVEDCRNVDRAGCLTLLDELAGDLAPPRADPNEMITAMASLLRHRLRLRPAGGGDPRNHYLHTALHRGSAIPITSAAIWISVGRRAGWDVEGVALPGHFVVRVAGQLVDAFAGGEPLDDGAARRIVGRALGDEPTRLHPAWLAGATPRQMLARMSRNLRGCYAGLEQWELALTAADRCVQLLPDEPSERRDRGLLRWRSGDVGGALEDLRSYLDSVPDARDRIHVEEMAARLRAALN